MKALIASTQEMNISIIHLMRPQDVTVEKVEQNAVDLAQYIKAFSSECFLAKLREELSK